MFNPLRLIRAAVAIFHRGLEYDRMVTEVEITHDRMGHEISARDQVIRCIICDRPFILNNGDILSKVCLLCTIRTRARAKP
jgi:hypothetical protein